MSAFNKKIQKHVPQRLEVEGTSASFTVHTRLLELLPDECMVGLECCYMYDTSTTRVLLNRTTCNKVVFGGPVVIPFFSNFVPQPTVSPDGAVRNVYDEQINIVPEIFTNQFGTSDYIFQWAFNGWKFESSLDGPLLYLFLGKGTTSLQPPTGLSPNLNTFASIQPFDPILRDDRWMIYGICTLSNGSQRVIFKNYDVSFTGVFKIGAIISIENNNDTDPTYYNAYYTVQEVIDDSTIVVHVNVRDVQLIGHTNWNLLNITSGGYKLYTWDTTLAIGTSIIVICPQTIISINRIANTAPVLKVNNTVYNLPSQLLNLPSTFTPAWNVNVDCDVRLLYQIDTYTDSPIAGPQYINIESPLFTSSRTFNTTTNSYSSTIATVPVINNTVSYIQPVNNRNCSMYQINKNILNNFDIPFSITTDSNHTLYTPIDKPNFKIKFNLWFYSQTDDERYFYIPSL